MFEITAMVDDSITIHSSDYPEPLTINNFWLRDHCCCPECYNHETKQRQISFVDIPIDIKPSHYNIDGQELQITCKCLIFLCIDNSHQLVDAICREQDMEKKDLFV